MEFFTPVGSNPSKESFFHFFSLSLSPYDYIVILSLQKLFFISKFKKCPSVFVACLLIIMIGRPGSQQVFWLKPCACSGRGGDMIIVKCFGISIKSNQIISNHNISLHNNKTSWLSSAWLLFCSTSALRSPQTDRNEIIDQEREREREKYTNILLRPSLIINRATRLNVFFNS